MSRTAAIFDVDGTLVRANVVDYYLFLIRGAVSPGQKLLRYLSALVKAPYWMVLERIDRARFNRSFYRSYRGLSARKVSERCSACFEDVQARRLIWETIRRLEDHRDRGDQILLVSGSLDFILSPLAEYLKADACLCPSLVEEEGSFSGEMKTEPVIGEEKARLVRDYAKDHDIDLSQSYAYADSASDLPVLQLVGHATVVRPGAGLKRVAKDHGWAII